MRARAALALALLLAALPAAAGHGTLLDETKVVGCLALVRVGGVQGSLNCGYAKEVAAAEPPGGLYRLTLTWSGGSDLATLQVDLRSCDGPCPSTSVCINNVCQGNPPGQVQHASAVGTSPLVLSIPTAGNEDRVQVAIAPPGPAFASLQSASLRVVLEHA
jgi:hypothetical protein